MTDNYGEHQCAECGTPLSRPGLCARCKALNSCSQPEQLTELLKNLADAEDDNEDS